MKNYIPRTLEKSLTSVSPSRAYMLYGARQVGKTSLLRHKSNFSMIEKIPPKGVSFSDLICIFAMSY